MTLEQLIAAFRVHAQDKPSGDGNPSMWTDSEVIDFANAAQIEAARRARLITDSTTTEICQIAVTANDGVVELDPRIILVRRVRSSTNPTPLLKTRLSHLERMDPDFEARDGSMVERWCPDYQTGALLLYPKCTAAHTLRMTVIREPLDPMEALDDEPEINARYHRSLVYHMLFLAYSSDDQEKADPKKAAVNAELFALEFGFPSPAKQERWAHETEGYDEDGTY